MSAAARKPLVRHARRAAAAVSVLLIVAGGPTLLEQPGGAVPAASRAPVAATASRSTGASPLDERSFGAILLASGGVSLDGSSGALLPQLLRSLVSAAAATGRLAGAGARIAGLATDALWLVVAGLVLLGPLLVVASLARGR